jgi:xyloglucan:xyloglucosyl transferase
MGFLGWATLAVVYLAMVGVGYGATFEEQFTAFSTDGYHVQVAPDGQVAQIVLDQTAASGFGSKHQYLFGNITMKIKLVPGDSAGTVTAYYLSSAQPAHDELDFEFLGNTSGQPYVLQTNVFANGVGRREQRINLWFDPSADFHNYGVLWNKKQIIFTVDNKPIRVFKNQEDIGLAYPNSKPMGLYASLWNGDQWATQGGLVKLNWTHAPFVVSFKEFSTLDGCVVTDNDISPCTATTSHWWEASAYQTIDRNQAEQILWVKENYEVYDYCTDTERYPTEPVECARNVPLL